MDKTRLSNVYALYILDRQNDTSGVHYMFFGWRRDFTKISDVISPIKGKNLIFQYSVAIVQEEWKFQIFEIFHSQDFKWNTPNS